MEQLDWFACVLLEDLGAKPRGAAEAEALFALVAARAERCSVVLVTPAEERPVSDAAALVLATILARVGRRAVMLDLGW